MSDFTTAIAKLRPGVEFANVDNTLSNVRWDTPGVVPPTQAEVDAAVQKLGIPAVITYTQAIRQLNAMGILDQAVAAVDGAGAFIKCLFASPSWHRDAPDLIAMAQNTFGMDDAAMDAFFTAAAQR